MNKALIVEYKKRLEEKITQGKEIPLTPASDMHYFPGIFEENDKLFVDSLKFSKWKTQSLNLIDAITGENSQHFKNFNKINKPTKSKVDEGLGILLALREDMEDGYIEKLKYEILSVQYSTLLETAQDFLDDNQKDPAGVLAGVALEETLRQIADKYAIKHATKATLLTLNQCIADSKKVYDDTIRKEIVAWNDVRDKAAHAKWKEFSKVQVKQLIEGTNKLIADYL